VGNCKAGRTLTLVRPREPRFIIELKATEELEEERAERATLHAQAELFPVRRFVPLEPCPHRFKYAYRIDDGRREGTCEDWETEATYFNWRNRYGEQRALSEMQRMFGDRYPTEGMAFAMGTHSRFPDRWLIVGVLRFNEVQQPTLL
jgi:hypothetical protein